MSNVLRVTVNGTHVPTGQNVLHRLFYAKVDVTDITLDELIELGPYFETNINNQLVIHISQDVHYLGVTFDVDALLLNHIYTYPVPIPGALSQQGEVPWETYKILRIRSRRPLRSANTYFSGKVATSFTNTGQPQNATVQAELDLMGDALKESIFDLSGIEYIPILMYLYDTATGTWADAAPFTATRFNGLKELPSRRPVTSG